MSKKVKPSEADELVGVAMGGLMTQLLRRPETTRRVSSGLYVFKVKDEYVFRLFPGLRYPVFIDHVVLLSNPSLVQVGDQKGIDLGPIDVAPIGGLLFNSAREAATALVPLAVGMYRAQVLTQAMAQAAPESEPPDATPVGEDVVREVLEGHETEQNSVTEGATPQEG